MSKKIIGYVLIFIGAAIAVVSAIADLIGLGDQLGVGWQQLLLVVVGFYISFIGLWQLLGKPS